jgi:hypothetical protein
MEFWIEFPPGRCRSSGRAGNEEESMDQQDQSTAVEHPAEYPAVFPAAGQQLYLPFGGTDPDFYIPADHERNSGGISRWFRSLPVFGRKRP